MNYAIWTAVSTKKQAEKVSLSKQESLCRTHAHGQGWIEASGPYIVPGESRTRWVNLRDAEDEIPALKKMLNHAQAGYFHILICYDYSRFRDLLDPIARTLSHYGVQLFSISQTTNIIDPSKFGPYTSDSAMMMRTIYQMQSRSEINTMRRRHSLGMPKRIERGLPPNRIPYGYRKPKGQEYNRDAIPEQDPITSSHVRTMLKLFFAGKSGQKIANHLNEDGIRPPRPKNEQSQWRADTIIATLKNPFYAGVVQWGAKKWMLDPRTGKSTPHPNLKKNIITADGAHIPLWDNETHTKIMDEMKRRRNTGYKARRTHNLSSLMLCGTCGTRLYNDNWKNKTFFWRCKNTDCTDHTKLTVDQANDLVAQALIVAISQDTPLPALPEGSEEEQALVQRAIKELKAKQDRIELAYEKGAYPLPKFVEKNQALEKEIAHLQNKTTEELENEHTRLDIEDTLNHLRTIKDTLPQWIRKQDAESVNRTLHILLKEIVVSPTHEIQLIFN